MICTPVVNRSTREGQRNKAFHGAQCFAFVALLCSLFVLWGCSSDSKPTTARAGGVQTIPVSVSTAKEQDMPVYLTGLGTVTAFNTVSVRSRVDGQLVQVA